MNEFEEQFPKPQKPADYSYRAQFENYEKKLADWEKRKEGWLAHAKQLQEKIQRNINLPPEDIVTYISVELDREIEELENVDMP